MARQPAFAKRPRDITLKQVDADVVNALADEAAAQARSLSAHIRFILSQYVRGQGAGTDAPVVSGLRPRREHRAS